MANAHSANTSPTDNLNDESHEAGFSVEERRQLELRLLHHFTFSVTPTFPYANHPDTAYTWNVAAVELGFEYPFLLNAILALAALHMVRDLPLNGRFNSVEPEKDFSALRLRIIRDPKPLLGQLDPQRVHHFYLSLAVSQQSEATANMTAENSNALILSSVMLSYQALGLRPQAEQESNGYSPPTQWLRMANATSGLARASLKLLPEGVEHAANILASTIDPPELDFRDRSAIFNPENGRPFADLLDWNRFPEPNMDADTMEVYEDALSLTGGIYRGMLESEPPRTVFRRLAAYGAMISPKFISFIEQRRPRALALFALFCALSKALDQHWIWHGFADREVQGLQTLLPDEWQWAMEWPLTLLEKEYICL